MIHQIFVKTKMQRAMERYGSVSIKGHLGTWQFAARELAIWIQTFKLHKGFFFF